MIADPNDAGKTTFAREYLPHEMRCFEFINNDLIAAGLAPLQPDRAQQRAARIVIAELRQLEQEMDVFDAVWYNSMKKQAENHVQQQ